MTNVCPISEVAKSSVSQEATDQRAAELFDEQIRALHVRTDRLFAGLMLFQLVAGIVGAILISPRTWIGSSSHVHIHVWASVVLGATITSLPVLLALTRPGHVLTRHVIAVSQMLMSALLIHISGGRIETHFHVFGSLAFLAFYRDWKVLVSASVVVAVDHFFRGIFWPQSVFGVLTASRWRWVEHAAWVVFEDIFLIRSCRQSVREMWELATRQARLEATNEIINVEVRQRTADLGAANARLTHELAVARELSDAADREHQLWLQGESIVVRALRESIEASAASDDPLLLTGPTGAGQEAVARAVHRNSPRAGRPFIYVACPHVITSEDTVFGFRTSGTEQANPGKMALADGGTLYLEGIEALGRSAQENLLKALRDAADRRANGKTPVPDVRIVTYASSDLADLVRQGKFDGELMRLLGAERLAVPSLAERRDDVTSLANSIVASRALSLGKAIDGLSRDSEKMLLHYSWPGNLEELQSVIERAVVLAQGTSVDVPADLLREGRRIGGYTLERQLGSGAMGEVWLGRHALLARPSAVKLIRQEALQGDSNTQAILEQRFQREAQATSQLRSPHTVELYDFGITEDGGFYYVMEYLNGVDLDSLVTKFGPVDPERAVYLLRQACLSLGEAHQVGLVHRDVKPANFFACRLGPHFDFLKLLDFGIVRTTTDVSQTVTSVGQIRGTPTSLSPEVIEGKDAGFEADIYGLGCVAYWLLSGQHVFDAPNAVALLVQHVSKMPKPLSEHRSDLPGPLDELVLSCLRKEPSERPSSAFELGERLASIPFENGWSNRRAQTWWNHNVSDQGESTSKDGLSETMVFDSSDTE